MKKVLISFMVLLIIIIFASLACKTSILGSESVRTVKIQAEVQSLLQEATQAAQITATFGAERFHLQLTAIAEQEP